MNPIESKERVSLTKTKEAERMSAFCLPARTLICVHVATMMDAPRTHLPALLRPNRAVEILPFTGPSCRPLRDLNECRRSADLVVFVSDGRCWADFGTMATGQGKRLATMAEEWMIFRARNPRARLVLLDLQERGMTRVMGHPEVLRIGGFSDAMFRVVSLFAAGKLDVAQ
jgi:hypothetical protein